MPESANQASVITSMSSLRCHHVVEIRRPSSFAIVRLSTSFVSSNCRHATHRPVEWTYNR
eukprot:9478702-Pyramimonas_sp.AAC.1